MRYNSSGEANGFRLLCRHVLNLGELARRAALASLHPLATQHALLFDRGQRPRRTGLHPLRRGAPVPPSAA